MEQVTTEQSFQAVETMPKEQQEASGVQTFESAKDDLQQKLEFLTHNDAASLEVRKFEEKERDADKNFSQRENQAADNAEGEIAQETTQSQREVKQRIAELEHQLDELKQEIKRTEMKIADLGRQKQSKSKEIVAEYTRLSYQMEQDLKNKPADDRRKQLDRLYDASKERLDRSEGNFNSQIQEAQTTLSGFQEQLSQRQTELNTQVEQTQAEAARALEQTIQGIRQSLEVTLEQLQQERVAWEQAKDDRLREFVEGAYDRATKQHQAAQEQRQRESAERSEREKVNKEFGIALVSALMEGAKDRQAVLNSLQANEVLDDKQARQVVGEKLLELIADSEDLTSARLTEIGDKFYANQPNADRVWGNRNQWIGEVKTKTRQMGEVTLDIWQDSQGLVKITPITRPR